MTTIILVIAMIGQPDRIGPPPSRNVQAAFQMMGGGCWHCREAGMRSLDREARSNPRMLAYVADGINDRDPEIRWRCRKILARRKLGGGQRDSRFCASGGGGPNSLCMHAWRPPNSMMHVF